MIAVAITWAPGLKDTQVLVHTGGWNYELAGQLEHVTDKGVLGLFSSGASMSLKQAFW